MVADPWQLVLDEVAALRREAEDALEIPPQEVPLQLPPEGFGDIGFPVHGYAKVLNRSPDTVAAELAEAMRTRRYVAAHEARGGYVNSRLHYPAFGERTLQAILEEGEGYGRAAPLERRVIVEHSSVNPTGPVHVGNTRNAIIGDTMARLLDWAGYDVTREFLVNDAGRQVLTLVWGHENLPEKDLDPPEREKADYRLVRFYLRASELVEADPEVAGAVDDFLRRFESGDAALQRRVREVCEAVMKGILETLSRLFVEFDHFFWEDQTILDGSAQAVVERLKGTGHTQEEDGALFIDMEPFGIPGRDVRWFITRKDGSTLYPTRDLAYHLDKFGRSEEAINVLGEDHRLEFRQLSVALQLLGVEQEVESLFYASVTLPGGRLSKRKGRVVNLDELMEEAVARALREVGARREDLSAEEKRRIAEAVGISALRYNLVKVQPEKPIRFHWEEALSLEGQTAPFLQYAHARAWGILRKAEGEEKWDAGALDHPQERALLKLLARFPGTLKEAAGLRRPHQMATFAHELATTFNLFYRDCPVLAAEGPLRGTRLALVRAFRTVLHNALTSLAVTPLEAM